MCKQSLERPNFLHPNQFWSPPPLRGCSSPNEVPGASPHPPHPDGIWLSDRAELPKVFRVRLENKTLFTDSDLHVKTSSEPGPSSKEQTCEIHLVPNQQFLPYYDMSFNRSFKPRVSGQTRLERKKERKVYIRRSRKKIKTENTMDMWDIGCFFRSPAISRSGPQPRALECRPLPDIRSSVGLGTRKVSVC